MCIRDRYDEVVYTGTRDPVNIRCKIHGIFQQPPCNHLQGHGCSICSIPTEELFWRFLKKINSNVKHQFRPLWSRSNISHQLLPFDFVLEELAIVIELDDASHVEISTNNLLSFEKNQARDIFKMKKAIENGYSIIRFLVKDIFLDRNNAKQRLINSIKKYQTPTVVYIDAEDEYSFHKKLFDEQPVNYTLELDEKLMYSVRSSIACNIKFEDPISQD